MARGGSGLCYECVTHTISEHQQDEHRAWCCHIWIDRLSYRMEVNPGLFVCMREKWQHLACAQPSQWLCMCFLMSVLLMRLSSVWLAILNKGQAIKKNNHFTSAAQAKSYYYTNYQAFDQSRQVVPLVFPYGFMFTSVCMSAEMIISIILRDIIYESMGDLL